MKALRQPPGVHVVLILALAAIALVLEILP